MMVVVYFSCNFVVVGGSKYMHYTAILVLLQHCLFSSQNSVICMLLSSALYNYFAFCIYKILNALLIIIALNGKCYCIICLVFLVVSRNDSS